MSPSNQPSPRVERMKKMLAESFRSRTEDQRNEPLPASVRAALSGTVRSAERKIPFHEKLLSWLRGPQLIALGAAAVVIIFATVQFRPADDDGGGGGLTMRSGGGAVSGPPVIVLQGLSGEQIAALRDSGYFRPEQLLVAPAANAPGFLEENRRPNLVLINGESGEISAPFAGADGPEPILFPPGETDLAPLLLDMLANLPEPEGTE